MALIDKLNAIGEAIRAKTGKSEKLTLDEMPIEIGSITTSENLDTVLTEQEALIDELKEVLQGKASGVANPIIEPLQVTENGTYTAPDGVDGYSPIEVNVPIPEGYIKPSGTLEITENGTYDVTEYESVNVNVESGGGDAEADFAAFLGNTLTELNNSIATSLRTRICQYATNLVTVNLPNVTTMDNYAFYGCSSLVTVKLPKITSVSSSSFYTCTKLKHVDCGQVRGINAQAFNGCSSLTELILRKTDSICALYNVNGIGNSAIGKGTGYVYVPSALIDTYKAATNWSTYADQIRAIEDYPDICGG